MADRIIFTQMSVALSVCTLLLLGGATPRCWAQPAGDENESASWRELAARRLPAHSAAISVVAFSSDAKRLATAGYDEKLRVWQMPGAELLQTVSIPRTSAAFSSDLKHAAVAPFPIQQIELATGRTRHKLGATQLLAYSPTGDILAAAEAAGNRSSNAEIRLWRVSDGALVTTLSGHRHYVASIAFSPDGTLFASGGADGTVRLWSIPDGKLREVRNDHNERVGSLAFSPDGKLLASGGLDAGQIYVWRVPELDRLYSLWYGRNLSALAFSADGTLLATCGTSDAVGSPSLHLWRVSDGSQVQQLVEGRPEALCIAFSPQRKLLAAGMSDGTIRFFAPENEGAP